MTRMGVGGALEEQAPPDAPTGPEVKDTHAQRPSFPFSASVQGGAHRARAESLEVPNVQLKGQGWRCVPGNVVRSVGADRFTQYPLH
jgi:hypothetical protein